MKHKGSPLLLVMLALAFVAQGFIQQKFIFPQWERDFNPGKGRVFTGAMSP